MYIHAYMHTYTHTYKDTYTHMYTRGPQFPKKGCQKAHWSPQAKKWPVLSAIHILGSRFFGGPQLPKKGFQKGPGRHKPKSGQFYQEFTYWEAAFVKGPKSLPTKGFQKALACTYVCM